MQSLSISARLSDQIIIAVTNLRYIGYALGYNITMPALHHKLQTLKFIQTPEAFSLGDYALSLVNLRHSLTS